MPLEKVNIFFYKNLIYIRIIQNIFSPKIGEEVIFDKPVSTIEHPRINEWLSEVERQMRLTLANNLAKSLEQMPQSREYGNESNNRRPPARHGFVDLAGDSSGYVRSMGSNIFNNAENV